MSNHRRKILVTIVVSYDTEFSDIDETGGFCDITGDSYESLNDFVEHQVGRDLQVLKLEELISVETMARQD